MTQLAQLHEIQKMKAAQEAEAMMQVDDEVRIMIAPYGQMICSVASCVWVVGSFRKPR